MAKAQRVSAFRSAVEKIEEQYPDPAEVYSGQEEITAFENKVKLPAANEANLDFLSEKINRFLVTLIRMT